MTNGELLPLLLIPIYCFANRLAGDGAIFRKLKLRGRPLWYASVLALFLSTPIIGLTNSLLFSATFGFWRSLGWYSAIDGGTTDGQRDRDFWVMSGRGLLWFPIFVFTGWAILFPFLAFGIAGIYDISANILRKGKNPIPTAELISGAWIGLVLSAICYLYGIS